MTLSNRLTYFNEDQLEVLKEKTFDLLENHEFKIDHPQMIKILDKAGCVVDADRRMVKFPRQFVQEQIDKAPKEFTVAGRGGKFPLKFPHPDKLFYTRTNTGGQAWLDPETKEFRRVTSEDLKYWGRLADRLDHIDFYASIVPDDVPHATADVHTIRTALENVDKMIWVQPYTFETVEYLVELGIAAAGGEDKLREHPHLNFITCALTPFGMKDMDVEIILQCAKRGIPMQPCSLPGSGTTGPVTAPGVVLLSAAETLMMLSLAQTVQPGIPIITTSLQFSADMKTGRSLQSTPLAIRQSALFTQLMHRGFGLQAHTYGSGTDSADIDEQSMIERALRTMMIASSGSAVLGGAGQFETACSVSPVQLTIDNETFRLTKEILKEMSFDDDALAMDVLEKTAPGGQFLTDPHTLRHCRDGIQPINFCPDSRDTWERKKRGTLIERATENMKEIMKDAGPVELPSEIIKEMDAVVKRADQKLIR
ncbi:trimethylamine methyltransferase family protein [Desulforhopalus singaporensis]|uniref:Trimethylamine:corrinoid methyltransferase n=1 Tax=Desulforhopalus singaporensis TaxID=91360 RepID=A0A1H0N613_9BACT|nr:trimethylamine methyltransferase family protein [Desulforhopalus singaporensis]SDO88169.1 Trimethylamine:corrinoid methyltransferase [Desulforhopalus singaporensis]